MKASVLIADDEPLARRTLREHLCGLGWTGPMYEACDGKTAISITNSKRPDVLFLDIVMPGATGLEVLEQLSYEPRVIFTTAYDQYAVTAFELGALDYLLKPFGRERLERVLRRVQAALEAPAPPLLSRARQSLGPARPLSRIFVRDGNRILPIPLTSIERIQGTDDYVTICTANKEYLVSIRLSGQFSQDSSLPPDQPRTCGLNRAIRFRAGGGGDENRLAHRGQPHRFKTSERPGVVKSQVRLSQMC
jgi:two-component system LytT family response regulator